MTSQSPHTLEFSFLLTQTIQKLELSPHHQRSRMSKTAVTTLKPQINLKSFWISRRLTDYKETFLLSPPVGWWRDCSPEQLLRRSFHSGLRKTGKAGGSVGGVSTGQTGSEVTHLSLLLIAYDVVSWLHLPPSEEDRTR